MTVCAHIGFEDVSERELFVVDAPLPEDVPSVLPLQCKHFVCLLAWDSQSIPTSTILALASRICASGCAYICCWGPGCERAHDIFDEADLKLRPNGPWVMSTWHNDEPLSEAIWFSLFNSYPDDAYFDQCRAVVGITIGAPEWATEIRSAFLAPRNFSARFLASEADDA